MPLLLVSGETAVSVVGFVVALPQAANSRPIRVNNVSKRVVLFTGRTSKVQGMIVASVKISVCIVTQSCKKRINGT
jgi:hypothetical protein